MKTLINKNKIRLAGGLLVLLMTAILAVATAKSYAWEWYGNGQCWHIGSLENRISPYSMFNCCGSCYAVIPWYVSIGPEPGDTYFCVSGPDSNGYGYASCQTLSEDETVQTGYSICIGTCSSSQNCGIINGQCACWCNMTDTFYVTGTTTVPKGYTFLSGGLECYPEN